MQMQFWRKQQQQLSAHQLLLQRQAVNQLNREFALDTGSGTLGHRGHFQVLQFNIGNPQ